MRFSLTREVLLKPRQQVVNVVERRQTLPVLANLLVSVEGNKLVIADNRGQGAYELSGPADKVKLEVLSPAGAVLDTVELGAQSGGLHQFDWSAEKSKGYTQVNFRITATSGTAVVSNTLYSTDKVAAVSTSSTGKLQVQLENLGQVDYSAIKAID